MGKFTLLCLCRLASLGRVVDECQDDEFVTIVIFVRRSQSQYVYFIYHPESDRIET